ncbi:8125_t:CDS:2 [Funneliformis caledonium]|uniref:8125_t:CDS:1 n=1 Tax=Funneliformis caledonium TaxID=1117310 RepID=A0A9N8ZJB7_9GLOM|nr:8125_t:CDS:2 [Funneliformis caledonium]
MTDESFSESNDAESWVENGIANHHIIYHDYEEFQRIQRIDTEGSSNVYKANWKSTNTIVTLKSFGTKNCITKNFVNELQLLHQVNPHENIIRFFGITKRTYSNYLAILEYTDSGTLSDYLKVNFKKLDWKVKLQFATQIASAVSFLHQRDIIHNDLHSNNILIHQNVIKLTNFGLSRKLSEVTSNPVTVIFEALTDLSSDPGTLAYTDPQYLRMQAKCWRENPNDRPNIQQVFTELKQINLNEKWEKLMKELDQMQMDEGSTTVINSNDNDLINNELLSLLENAEQSEKKNKEIRNEEPNNDYVQSVKQHIMLKNKNENDFKLFAICYLHPSPPFTTAMLVEFKGTMKADTICIKHLEVSQPNIESRNVESTFDLHVLVIFDDEI